MTKSKIKTKNKNPRTMLPTMKKNIEEPVLKNRTGIRTTTSLNNKPQLRVNNWLVFLLVSVLLAATAQVCEGTKTRRICWTEKDPTAPPVDYSQQRQQQQGQEKNLPLPAAQRQSEPASLWPLILLVALPLLYAVYFRQTIGKQTIAIITPKKLEKPTNVDEDVEDAGTQRGTNFTAIHRSPNPQAHQTDSISGKKAVKRNRHKEEPKLPEEKPGDADVLKKLNKAFDRAAQTLSDEKQNLSPDRMKKAKPPVGDEATPTPALRTHDYAENMNKSGGDKPASKSEEKHNEAEQQSQHKLKPRYIPTVCKDSVYEIDKVKRIREDRPSAAAEPRLIPLNNIGGPPPPPLSSITTTTPTSYFRPSKQQQQLDNNDNKIDGAKMKSEASQLEVNNNDNDNDNKEQQELGNTGDEELSYPYHIIYDGFEPYPDWEFEYGFELNNKEIFDEKLSADQFVVEKTPQGSPPSEYEIDKERKKIEGGKDVVKPSSSETRTSTKQLTFKLAPVYDSQIRDFDFQDKETAAQSSLTPEKQRPIGSPLVESVRLYRYHETAIDEDSSSDDVSNDTVPDTQTRPPRLVLRRGHLHVFKPEQPALPIVQQEKRPEKPTKQPEYKPPASRPWVDPIPDQILPAPEMLQIKVLIGGDPTPDIYWTRDGKPLNENDGVIFDSQKGPHGSMGQRTFIAGLTLPRTKREDSGLYKIRVSNQAGERTEAAKVTVLTLPDAPRGPMIVTDIGHGSCHLKWNTPDDDGGTPLTDYVVDRKVGSHGEWATVCRVEPATGPEAVVNDCTPGRNHRFRVAAVNGIGKGEPLGSTTILLTTDGDTSSIPVRNIPMEHEEDRETKTTINFDAPQKEELIHNFALTNRSPKQKMGWYVRTNNPKRLEVKPPYGLLDPKEKSVLKVIVQPFGPGEQTKKDRFAIFWVKVPDSNVQKFDKKWLKDESVISRRKDVLIHYHPVTGKDHQSTLYFQPSPLSSSVPHQKASDKSSHRSRGRVEDRKSRKSDKMDERKGSETDQISNRTEVRRKSPPSSKGLSSKKTRDDERRSEKSKLQPTVKPRDHDRQVEKQKHFPRSKSRDARSRSEISENVSNRQSKVSIRQPGQPEPLLNRKQVTGSYKFEKSKQLSKTKSRSEISENLSSRKSNDDIGRSGKLELNKKHLTDSQRFEKSKQLPKTKSRDVLHRYKVSETLSRGKSDDHRRRDRSRDDKKVEKGGPPKHMLASKSRDDESRSEMFKKSLAKNTLNDERRSETSKHLSNKKPSDAERQSERTKHLSNKNLPDSHRLSDRLSKEERNPPKVDASKNYLKKSQFRDDGRRSGLSRHSSNRKSYDGWRPETSKNDFPDHKKPQNGDRRSAEKSKHSSNKTSLDSDDPRPRDKGEKKDAKEKEPTHLSRTKSRDDKKAGNSESNTKFRDSERHRNSEVSKHLSNNHKHVGDSEPRSAERPPKTSSSNKHSRDDRRRRSEKASKEPKKISSVLGRVTDNSGRVQSITSG